MKRRRSKAEKPDRARERRAQLATRFAARNPEHKAGHDEPVHRSPAGVCPARVLATAVLVRVTADGAYASHALDAGLRKQVLSPRDTALATELVYGTLRALPRLDALLAAAFDRPNPRLDALVRAALRVAAYQLHHLSRVPVHAAVSEAVSLVKHERGVRLARFANAVLRKLAQELPAERQSAMQTQLPAWIEQKLACALDAQRLRSFCEPAAFPPALGLRLTRAAPPRHAFVECLRRQLPQAAIHSSTLAPNAVLVRRGGDPRRLPGFSEGWFTVQEEGSQLVGCLVDAQPGQQVADVCAGHGSKSAQLAERVGPGGRIAALDLHEIKLERLATEFDRLGIQATLRVQTADLRVGTAGLGPVFDRVLVDVPCSGLGTLHRRPELLLRLSPARISALAKMQFAILSQAAELVRPGGFLVYAVCSPLTEEGADVVGRFEATRTGMRQRVRRVPVLPACGLPASDHDGMVRLGPWCGPGTGSPDVYQVARWAVA